MEGRIGKENTDERWVERGREHTKKEMDERERGVKEGREEERKGRREGGKGYSVM